MSDENDTKKEKDGDNVNENETREKEKEKETKEPKSVSFNRDVHVKRFGKIRKFWISNTLAWRLTKGGNTPGLVDRMWQMKCFFFLSIAATVFRSKTT